MNLLPALARLALAASMETVCRAQYARLLQHANRPERAQQIALQGVLKLCRRTEQGRRFGLANVKDAADFRRAVPIQTYEDIRTAVERQMATGALEISPEPPLMYARTSGTTGRPKYIPVTATTLRQARAAQRAMAFPPYRSVGAFGGRVLGIGGAAEEERMPNGVIAGAVSGLIYRTMPGPLRASYALPAEVFDVEDYELKYLLIARLAMAAADLTLISTANPATVLRLMAIVSAHRAHLLQDLNEGGFHALSSLPTAVRRAVVPLLDPAPEVAKRLAAIDVLTLARVWPRLRAVVTWLGGGCAHAAAAVRAQLPSSARMIDAGYVASELRGTIVVDAERNLALPLLADVFFEFVENDRWDRGVRDTLLIHELEQGRDYQIIVSTAAGLLRYRMNDVMRVVGVVGATPALTFVRKGRGVTNIVGEKVSEDQIHAAVSAVFASPPIFFIAVADARAAVYRLYVECAGLDSPHLAKAFDAKLHEINIEYAAKRASGRLSQIEIVYLRRGAGAAYHRHCVEVKGQRESQIKTLALQSIEDLDFDLNGFADTNAA